MPSEEMLLPCDECDGQGGTDGYDQNGDPTHRKVTCAKCGGSGEIRRTLPLSTAVDVADLLGVMAGYADGAPIAMTRPIRNALLAAKAAIAALPCVGWRQIDENTPHACHVLAVRFDESFGEWVYGVVMSPPSKPFTHWQPLPAPPLSKPAIREEG